MAFKGGPAKLQTDPAVILDKVEDAAIRNAKTVPGERVFLKVKGSGSREVHLVGNELHHATTPCQVDASVKPGTVKAMGNY